MDEPLGYNVYDSDSRTWLTAEGDWSMSFHDADEITTLEEANALKLENERHSNNTFYVFAVMPSP